MKPNLSILMSAHNEENVVGEAIESILNQTVSDYEFIIVDDGSTDGTAEKIRSYAKTDKRIRFLRNESNRTLTVSLNSALNACTGRFIARMDADDIALPQRLEKQLAFLADHPDVGIVGSFYKEIDSKNRELPRKQNPVTNPEIKKALFFYNPIAHPTAMIRRDVFDELGGYDESFPTAQDYEFFARAALKWELYNIPEVLLIRRFPNEVFHGSKLRRQDINANRVRFRLLIQKRVPWYFVFYFMKSLLFLLVPTRLRETIRRLRHRASP